MNFNDISFILRDLYLQFGDDLFSDDHRLKAAFADMLQSYPKERRLLSQAVDDGLVLHIVHTPEPLSYQRLQALTMQLSDSFAMQLEVSEQIVMTYEYAVHGVRNTSVKNASEDRKYEYRIKYERKTKQEQIRENFKSQDTSAEESEYHIRFKPGENRTHIVKNVDSYNGNNQSDTTTSEYHIKFR